MHATASTNSRSRHHLDRDSRASCITLGELIAELSDLCDSAEEVTVVLEYILARRGIRSFGEREEIAIHELRRIGSQLE